MTNTSEKYEITQQGNLLGTGGPGGPGCQCGPGGPGGQGCLGSPGDQVCQCILFLWSKQSNDRKNLRCHVCD